jgi:hypothetical protein
MRLRLPVTSFCLSLLLACQHLPADLATNETTHLVAHIPEGWIAHHPVQSSALDFVEFLPSGQDPLNWQSKLVLERTRAAITLTPAQILEQADQKLADDCYSFSRALIFSGQEYEMDSAVTLAICRTTKGQHNGLIQLSKAIWAGPEWYFIKIRLKVPAFTEADELKHQHLIKYWSAFLRKNIVCVPDAELSACGN